MSVVVIPKFTKIPNNVPSESNLKLGEICINCNDEILYFRNPNTGEILKFPGLVIKKMHVDHEGTLLVTEFSTTEQTGA